MIEPVIERYARDGDAHAGHIGEIGKPKPARHMRLREDHVPLRAMLRPPFADAPFQSAAHAPGSLRRWQPRANPALPRQLRAGSEAIEAVGCSRVDMQLNGDSSLRKRLRVGDVRNTRARSRSCDD